MAIASAKVALRRAIKAKLAEITIDYRIEVSTAVMRKIIDHPVYQKSSRVAVYMSMPDELDTTLLLKHIFESGKTCFVPSFLSRTTHHSMEMLQLFSMEDAKLLPYTKWNIQQPNVDDKRRLNALDSGLDFILVPGLAFTGSGKRLGRGGGYYDTYLRRFEDSHVNKECLLPYLLAGAYPCQLVGDVPTDETDYTIAEILTM